MYNQTWEFKKEQKTSGIYKIINVITNECYIGASKNVFFRKREHRNKFSKLNKKNSNSLLYIAMRKYGIENFNFEFLEKCDLNELDEREKYYIKLFHPAYNQTPGGKGGHLNKPEKFNEIVNDLKEDKMTMKEIAKKYGYCPETIQSINAGKTWNEEGLKYPIRKHDQKKLSRQLHSKRIYQFDLEGNFIKEWNSPLEFGEFIKAKSNSSIESHIYEVCKGKRKTAFGFVWKYAE